MLPSEDRVKSARSVDGNDVWEVWAALVAGPAHSRRVLLVDGMSAFYFLRSALPGFAPVCLPRSSTTWPLTITYSIPSLYWNGSVYVAVDHLVRVEERHVGERARPQQAAVA